MKKLHKNIYHHTTRDGFNIGCIVGETGIVSIDLPMSADETRQWKAQLAELNPKPLRAVIYTSADRVSFEAIEALGAPIMLHEAVRAQLYTPVEIPSMNPFDASVTMIAPAQNKLPEMSFTENGTIVINDKHPLFVDVTHQGGHSNGSAFVTLRDSGVVFAGEHAAVEQPPVIAQGNFARWTEVLTTLKRNKAVTTVVPGRGPVGGPDIGAATLDYIKHATTRVKAHLRARRARNELVALVPDMLKIYGLTDKGALKLGVNLDVVRLNIRAGLERLFDDLKSEA